MAFLSSCAESFYFKKPNRKDKYGKKHGLWITYWDDEKTIPMNKAWFDHGRELWLTKTYHSNGELAVKFREKKDGLLVKYYEENGKISHKGPAIFEISEEDIHYYWHGEWKYYDSRHRVIKRVLYKNGEEDSLATGNSPATAD